MPPPSALRPGQSPSMCQHMLACTVAFLLLGGAAARPQRRRLAQQGTRPPLRDAASWLSEAAGLDRSGAVPQDVLVCVDAALAVDPRLAVAHYNRGTMLDKLGAPPEEELACYDAALEIACACQPRRDTGPAQSGVGGAARVL